ncbi:carbon-nitrogen hydrolase family protein [Pararhizobium sp. YC-54]|uniref:carbon-nitrogen hydrolase family protein n=1 Tax=Pararhizobium sp. YC-54 TaxID=2986920 RepID=UPI0021F69E43|nr:carbon-nitrogen hydrolase family protein [Pararhizobium sp. YC-54]MCV9999477.1 carbon-nitrogen hydrolase family protein [Pararhizobium sp. YC-54]
MLRTAVFQSKAQAIPSPEARITELSGALNSASTAPQIVVCPELFLSGYGCGEMNHTLAEASDGSFTRKIGEVARAHRCCIVYGYPERTEDGVYNSAAVVAEDGSVVANHRKTLLPNAYERSLFLTGSGFSSFAIENWKIAVAICYEVEFPEILRSAALQGADLVVVPTALTQQWGIVAHQVVPTRAFESGIFVAYANHSGEENNLSYLGASCIVGPSGKDLERAGASDGLIEATLDKAEITRARKVLPYLEDRMRLRDFTDFIQ